MAVKNKSIGQRWSEAIQQAVPDEQPSTPAQKPMSANMNTDKNNPKVVQFKQNTLQNLMGETNAQ